MTNEEVWIKAYCAYVAAGFNIHHIGSNGKAAMGADRALEEYRAAFPATPLPVIGG